MVMPSRLFSRTLACFTLCCLAATAFADTPSIPKKKKRGADDFVLVAGGDVAYPRGWMDRLVVKQGAAMFDFVRPLAKDADLAFVNLESPYTNEEFKLRKEWQIATPPERLDYVLDGGFNLFSLANNHMGDTGDQGIFDTITLLEQKHETKGPLFWAGASRALKDVYKPTVFEVPGKKLKVVFFAFGYAKNAHVPMPGPSAIEAIEKAKGKGDIVIVSVHSGVEYKHVPDKSKADMYRRMIDAGADILLGSHPHVIQGVEVYKKGIIFHSLGNFSFASKTTRHHKTGAKLYSLMPRIYVKNGRVEMAELVPLYVNNGENFVVDGAVLKHTDMKPQVLTGVFAKQVLTELEAWTHAVPGISEKAKAAYEIQGDRAIVTIAK
jgi:poly-gamma-glutamate synthesis protein (capsule biosynthesis protein)